MNAMVTERYEPARMLWFGVGHKAKAKRPAAGLLLIAADTGRVLLAERAEWMAAGGTWSTPGGVIDEGEGPLAGAVREFEEELGIMLGGPENITYVTEYTTWDHRRSYTVFVCTVDWEFDTSVDGHETTDADWFEVDTALQMKLHPSLYAVLRDFR